MACSTEQFAVVMKGLRAMFPKFALDGSGMSVWYEALKDIDYDTLSRAAFQFGQRSKFPPTIAELREESKTVLFETTAFRIQEQQKLTRGEQKLIGPSTVGRRFEDVWELLYAKDVTPEETEDVFMRQSERLRREREAERLQIGAAND